MLSDDIPTNHGGVCNDCFKPIKDYNVNNAFGLKLCNGCLLKRERPNVCPVCKGEGGFKKKEGDHYRYDGDCPNCNCLGVVP